MKPNHGPVSGPARAVIPILILATCCSPLSADTNRRELDPKGKGGFQLLDPTSTGLSFANQVSLETVGKHATLIASGLAAGDVDGDGWCDLYFCSIDGPNVLYRNLGNWKFEDITAQAGVAHADRHSIGAAFADVDGDGDLDLITTARRGPSSLLINDGTGTFKEDHSFPLAGKIKAGTTPALADVDGDGDLDLYIANYRGESYGDNKLLEQADAWRTDNVTRMRAHETVEPDFAAQFFLYRGEIQEKGEADDFLLNNGDGSFSAVPAARFGAVPQAPGAVDGWGLCAQWRDHDGDGDPDLYVCNDFQTPDRMWINDGNARFTHVPTTAQRRQSYYAMAMDMADIDRDGQLDFFVADMMSRDHSRRKRQMGSMGGTAPQLDHFSAVPQIMQNTLFLARGDGSYAEIAQFAGVKASEWTWGALFVDLDLDGWSDLLTATGMVHDWMDADTQNSLQPSGLPIETVQKNRSKFPSLRTRNLVFRNQGDRSFKEIGASLGIQQKEVSGGVITADLDNDGDLDLVFNNIGAAAEVYRNESDAPRVALRLKGAGLNTRAVGAQVFLRGKNLTQQAEVLSGGHFASHCDDLLVFAIPPEGAPYSLDIRWRDGSEQRIEEVTANSLLEISQAKKTVPFDRKSNSPSPPLFTTTCESLPHVHHENMFNDFAVQPLLPNRLSRLGPGVTWFDADSDGDDDLLIGGSRGGSIALLTNDGGVFRATRVEGDSFMLPGDSTAMVTMPAQDGTPRIFLGISNWEQAEGVPSFRVLERKPQGQWELGIEARGQNTVSGPLALGDIDGDQRPDLFVGGRLVRDRYPESTSSYFLLDEDPGKASANPTQWSEALKDIGLVSGAVLADFDQDGDLDLALAREWDTPALLLNNGAGFDNVSKQWGLGPHTGWWNGIAAGDFNGDGKLDLLATNWGENSKYGRTPGPEHPMLVRFGDVDNNGSFDVIEAHTDHATNKIIPERGLSCSSGAIPSIRKRIPTYRAFGDADLSTIYGKGLGELESATAAEFRHGVFLNRGDHFEFLPLPVEAQWAPAFGVSVSDFDGNGQLDVFLAQNFFSTQAETPRNDAGRGLLLLGKGDGSFVATDAQQSGIALYGEQRGCASADYDQDGRSDLVVTQNDGTTRLFHNSTARPGLRVRIDAGPTNRSGLGAIIRPISEIGLGPARVITAGSGYWSQDSPVLVLTAPTKITAVQVTWPGGESTRHDVPKGAKEIRINRPQ